MSFRGALKIAWVTIANDALLAIKLCMERAVGSSRLFLTGLLKAGSVGVLNVWGRGCYGFNA